jgi:hypothetical protein
MATIRKPLLLSSLLLAVSLTLSVGAANAAKKPGKPISLLGSHPTKEAKTSRLAVLKTRTSSVPVGSKRSGKILNSLNSHPGKTITVRRNPPK